MVGVLRAVAFCANSVNIVRQERGGMGWDGESAHLRLCSVCTQFRGGGSRSPEGKVVYSSHRTLKLEKKTNAWMHHGNIQPTVLLSVGMFRRVRKKSADPQKCIKRICVIFDVFSPLESLNP